jgi:hypothetical protein
VQEREANLLEHDLVHFGLHSLLNIAQQVLLVHDTRRVHVSVHLKPHIRMQAEVTQNDLANVVKISVGHALLLAHLAHLVQEHMQLELVLQIAEPSKTETLSARSKLNTRRK